MQGAHSLSIGVKGEFSHAAQRRPMRQSMFHRKLEQGNFRRVSCHDIPTVGLSDTLGIVTMQQDVKKEPPLLGVGRADDAAPREEAAFA
jgi:hypothetical protein